MRSFSWFLLSALLLMILLVLGVEPFLEPVVHFAIGWIFSAIRLVNAFERSLAPLWWITACVGLVIGTHFFVNSWKKATLEWRTTFAVISFLFLSLHSGMTIGGTVHQVAWLATSSEPWIQSFRGSRNLSHLSPAADLIDDAIKGPMKLERWHSYWRAPLANGNSMHEMFATFVTVDSNGFVSEVVVWPRDNRSFDDIGGYLVSFKDRPVNYRKPEFLEILKDRRTSKNGN